MFSNRLAELFRGGWIWRAGGFHRQRVCGPLSGAGLAVKVSSPLPFFCLGEVALANGAKEGAIPFTVEPGTLVWSTAHKSVYTLKNLVKDVYPSAQSIIGYESFEMGKFPKELKEATPRVLALRDPHSFAIWQAVSGCKNVKAMFVLRLEDGPKGRMVPSGMALVNVTQWTVPKGEKPVECA